MTAWPFRGDEHAVEVDIIGERFFVRSGTGPRPPRPRSARAERNAALLAQGPAYALHALIDFAAD